MDRHAEIETGRDAPGFSLAFGTDAFPRIVQKIQEIERTGTLKQVEAALAGVESGHTLSEDQFALLASTVADPMLEQMAVLAQRITLQRFGRTVLLYAPMYLSNVCFSKCTYCGFSYGNDISRRTLTPEQIVTEAEILHEQGIRHILLLTGEAYRETPVEYIGEAAAALSSRFSSIGIEVYPLKEKDYTYLRNRGVDGLTVYQETYDPESYRSVHLKGMKALMNWRLDCADRGGRAGMRRLAIGALLGLSDPTAEVVALGLHGRYLLKNYWQSQLSISLPRLRPAAGLSDVPHIMDRQYVRYWLALRLFLPDAGFTLSSRESADFRDHMMQICITQVSGGARTEPGGYSGLEATEQFSRDDTRSVREMATAIVQAGKEPVFTDWASVLK